LYIKNSLLAANQSTHIARTS